jgi:hypothetical protein
MCLWLHRREFGLLEGEVLEETAEPGVEQFVWVAEGDAEDASPHSLFSSSLIELDKS